jgi:hypothetical protein
MPVNPPDKWTNSLDMSTYSTPALALQGLSDAWDAYHTTNGTWPTVWVAVGTRVFYGGY